METLKRKDVVKAAKEFNKVVILDEHPVQNLKDENLEKHLYDAMEFIEEGDEFSEKTDAVFNVLKRKYEPKPEPETKPKSKKEKAVEVGTTVEMDPDSDKVKTKKEKKMKNKNGSEMKEAARLVLDRGTKKDQLMELLESDLFTKKQRKELAKVGNFLSLKKQMKEALDADVIAEIEAEMKAAPKPKPASKPKAKKEKDSELVTAIKEATKVKHLKKIAKANDEFHWKALKRLDFDEMQTEMMKLAKPEPKVKMVPNPLIPMIEKFTKAKKLAKFAKDIEALPWRKSMKKTPLAELQEELIAAIPAEIPEEDSVSPKKKKVQINHIDQEARKARIIELVDEGKSTRKEIHAILQEEFPEEGKAHTNSNILSEMKSLVPYKDGFRWERFGVGRLATEDENGCYVWADEVEKPKSKKKGKKDKKNKKGKKSKKS